MAKKHHCARPDQRDAQDEQSGSCDTHDCHDEYRQDKSRDDYRDSRSCQTLHFGFTSHLRVVRAALLRAGSHDFNRNVQSAGRGSG